MPYSILQIVDGNLARTHVLFDARRMAIVALAVVLGIVLFDAHDFINRPRRV